jgi:hypothetical protein
MAPTAHQLALPLQDAHLSMESSHSISVSYAAFKNFSPTINALPAALAIKLGVELLVSAELATQELMESVESSIAAPMSPSTASNAFVSQDSKE